ncbi:hypothetical protein F4804DRAFT_311313 [Jackrogersella minutella]|nr:hypothetical protein F4804DRAFT_311313 [Jackrogersella minutella]
MAVETITNSTLHWGAAHFYPLVYQSQNIAFEEWISLFTLCLAPLIAHIASGAPRPSYISENRPRWHDRLCHFNPTSILFRYAAIADRRIRAFNWNTSTMAASNALFWTDQGWNGMDEMVSRGLPYCTLLPEHPRVEFVSWEMGKTIIITVQGSQPLYCLISLLAGKMYNTNTDMAVDGIFPSLALLGLLRLFAALWLTDDFVYTTRHLGDSRPMTLSRASTITVEGDASRKASLDSLLEPHAIMTTPLEMHFRPLSYWPSRVFRMIYFLAILSLATLVSTFLIPWSKEAKYTTTSLLVGMLNIVFLAVTILLYGYYSLRGTTSTIIPCISSVWYKIYTLFIMALMVALIIISSIESRETPCGKFTSLPGEIGDISTCGTPTSELLPVYPGSGQWFGLVSGSWADGHEHISVQNFTGSCIGSLLEDQSYSSIIG